LGRPFPFPKFGGPKISKFWRDFAQLRHLICKYLQNATRHRRSENDVVNYGYSRTGKLNSVYFGPQMAKNGTGVLTHPTGGHQAGHSHSFLKLFLQYRWNLAVAVIVVVVKEFSTPLPG